MNYEEKSVKIREKSGGQIFTGLKAELNSKEDLSVYYSPGIAGPCRVIAEDKKSAKKLTIKKNCVAIISDGSAVLGLGNIGPEAGLPVMEGKAMLFKNFAGVDAFPIVLDTQDVDEIVETIKNIAPTFGGINLEDIAAPRCFEIEQKLAKILDIPVFHDDQHGTAMVCLAALKNSLKIVGKKKEKVKIVISGAGAAGIAIAEMLEEWGAHNIEMIDSKGVISCDRDDLNPAKKCHCSYAHGKLEDVLKFADIFIGVSKPEILTKEMIKTMNSDPIIFALANPTPEIMPNIAKSAGARIVATGRSDFPNQINNVLIFPGFFRGLLDAGITKITIEMKIAAAEALADLVTNPTEEMIIPSPLDKEVAPAIAEAVKTFG
jgi:malate dehydrogenase (oxaloacetate-decarboxylating)